MNEPPIFRADFQLWRHRRGDVEGWAYRRIGAVPGPLDVEDPDFGWKRTLDEAMASVDALCPKVKA